jgi:hypothetical protein
MPSSAAGDPTWNPPSTVASPELRSASLTAKFSSVVYRRHWADQSDYTPGGDGHPCWVGTLRNSIRSCSDPGCLGSAISTGG